MTVNNILKPDFIKSENIFCLLTDYDEIGLDGIAWFDSIIITFSP